MIGEFTSDKKLTVNYENETVAELDMDFLHDGCPKLELDAVWNSNKHREMYRETDTSSPRQFSGRGPGSAEVNLDPGQKIAGMTIAEILRTLLGHPIIA